MLHRTERIDQSRASLFEGEYLRALVPCDPENCLFFDIETTGLSPETSFVFLIGAVCPEDGGWILHQYLIRYVQEERQLIEAFLALAENYTILVHFNGTTFDLPFLEKRAKAEGIDASVLGSLISVDLYQLLRPLKKMLQLGSMNQKALEEAAGCHRSDARSGKDMIADFWRYEAGGDQKSEDLMLLHNHDDVLGMAEVLRLAAYLSLKDGRIAPETVRVFKKSEDLLLFRFALSLPLPQPLAASFSTGEGQKLTLSVREAQSEIQVPVLCGELLYFFPDYKNYYYLPEEGRAIHKSVAAYVDPAYREKAKPQNCFAKKEGRFLWQPKQAFTPALRKSYESKCSYFELTENFCADQKAAASYVQMLLPSFFS